MWGTEEPIINDDGSLRYNLLQDISDNGYLDNNYLASNSFKTSAQGKEELGILLTHDHNYIRDELAGLPANAIALPRELEEQDSLLSSQRINDPLKSIEEYSTLNPFDENEIQFNEIYQNNIDSGESINYEEKDNLLFDNYEVKKEILSSEEKTDYFI